MLYDTCLFSIKFRLLLLLVQNSYQIVTWYYSNNLHEMSNDSHHVIPNGCVGNWCLLDELYFHTFKLLDVTCKRSTLQRILCNQMLILFLWIWNNLRHAWVNRRLMLNVIWRILQPSLRLINMYSYM